MTVENISEIWLDTLLASATNEPHIVLVTGPSGAGKTTWCTRLIEKVRARDLCVCGVLSPGVFEDGKKTGIELIDMATGNHRLLAVPRTQGASGILTPDWHFDPDALTWGDQLLRDLPDDCDVLIVDELGPLEFERGQGWQAGLRAVDARAYKFACVVVRPALLDRAQSRWPGSTVIHTGSV